MSYPSGWGAYVDAAKELGTPISPDYAVWASRFRAAKSLQSMVFDDLSQASQDAYFLATKITMVDTAIEALENASGVRAGDLKVFAMDAGYSLWEERKGEIALAMQKLTNRKILADWLHFCELTAEQVHNADLRFVLRAFRNLNSHGLFTPASSAIYRAANYRKLLLEITEAGLAAMEAKFAMVLKEGRLPSKAAATTWVNRLSRARLVGRIYVGKVIRVAEKTDGNLLVQRLRQHWQTLDIKNWQMSELTDQEPDDASLKGQRLSLDFRQQRELAELAGLDPKADVAAWQLKPNQLLVGVRDGFLHVEEDSRQVLARFFLPAGTLPVYLNDGELGVGGDGKTAVVTVSSAGSFVYLDFESETLQLFELEGLTFCKSVRYLPSIEGFVSVETNGHTLAVYSCLDLTLPEYEKPKQLLDQGFSTGWVHSGGLLPGKNENQLAIARIRDVLNFDTVSGEIEVLANSNTFIRNSCLIVAPQQTVVLEGEDGLQRLDLTTGAVDKSPALNQPRILAANSTGPALVVSLGKSSSLALIDARDWQIRYEGPTEFDTVLAATFFGDEKIAVLGKRGEDLRLGLYASNLGHELANVQLVDAGRVNRLLADADTERLIAWGKFDDFVLFLSENSGALEAKLVVGGALIDILVSSKSRRLYTVFRDENFMRVYGLDDLKLIDERLLPSPGEYLTLSQSGNSVFVLCEDGFLLKYPNS